MRMATIPRTMETTKTNANNVPHIAMAPRCHLVWDLYFLTFLRLGKRMMRAGFIVRLVGSGFR